MSATIGVIFDFDETLAPDSTTGFLREIGLDAEAFWQERVKRRLDAGWDPIPAYLHEMIEESRARPAGDRITRERLAAWGAQVAFFPGVEATFDALREAARAVDERVAVEFYLVSSGIGEVLRATGVAEEFSDLWSCDFHYDKAGAIDGVKNVVSFTEKTRFLFQISKGMIGDEWRSRAGAVNRKVDWSSIRIPFDRMVFVGDGQTDVPCFALMNRYGGIPIAVCDRTKPSRWEKAHLLMVDQRVDEVFAAEYEEGRALRNELHRAVETLAKGIVAKGMDGGGANEGA